MDADRARRRAENALTQFVAGPAMTDPNREREDRELKARLDRLHGRLAETQQHVAEEKAAEDSAMARAQATGKAWSMGMRMVSEFVGGILVGLAVGWLAEQFHRRVDDAPIEITVSLLTPFVAYLAAER